MSILEALNNANYSGIAWIVFIVLSLIEITPIRISPLGWIGKRINKDIKDQVAEVKQDLSEHIAQSYRTKILTFQDDIIAGQYKSKEQWKEVVHAITAYDVYCEKNHISNGFCKEASDFLLNEYRTNLKNKTFN